MVLQPLDHCDLKGSLRHVFKESNHDQRSGQAPQWNREEEIRHPACEAEEPEELVQEEEHLAAGTGRPVWPVGTGCALASIEKPFCLKPWQQGFFHDVLLGEGLDAIQLPLK